MEDTSGWTNLNKLAKKEEQLTFLPGHKLKMFKSNLYNCGSREAVTYSSEWGV